MSLKNLKNKDYIGINMLKWFFQLFKKPQVFENEYEKLYQENGKINYKKLETSALYNAAMFACSFNKNKNLNFSSEQIEQIIKQTDLSTYSFSQESLAMIAFQNNKDQNLNLSKEMIDYLIKNTDLNHFNERGSNLAVYAFLFNQSQHLNIDYEIFKYIFDNSTLSQNQLKKIQTSQDWQNFLEKKQIIEEKNMLQESIDRDVFAENFPVKKQKFKI